MADVLSRAWWLVALRGVLALIFGVLAVGYPGLTLITLVSFFGAYVFVDGVCAIASSIMSWSERDNHWLVLLSGIASVGIGIVTFRTPEITTLVLLLYIATWALVTGVLQVAAAIRLRKEIEGEIWLAISGVLSILFAFFLWLFPGAGALGLVTVIGAYAIVFGILLIMLGFRLRGWIKGASPAAA